VICPRVNCALVTGISVIWKHPKVGIAGIVATSTTTSEFEFLVFLPIFHTHTVGFTLQHCLQILSAMFAANVVANLFWGWDGCWMAPHFYRTQLTDR
jgi:hypothetical protein